MADSRHFCGGYFDGSCGGWSSPRRGGIKFDEYRAGGEEFGDDFGVFDDVKALGFAVFFFAQGAQPSDLSLG